MKEVRLYCLSCAGGTGALYKDWEELGIEVYFPDLSLCTDNAAMIASARILQLLSWKYIRFKLKRYTKLENIIVYTKY